MTKLMVNIWIRKITFIPIIVLLIHATYIDAWSCDTSWYGDNCDQKIVEAKWKAGCGYISIVYSAPPELIDTVSACGIYFDCDKLIENMDLISAAIGSQSSQVKCSFSCTNETAGSDTLMIYVDSYSPVMTQFINHKIKIKVINSTEIVELDIYGCGIL